MRDRAIAIVALMLVAAFFGMLGGLTINHEPKKNSRIVEAYHQGYRDAVAMKERQEDDHMRVMRGIGVCEWARRMSAAPLCSIYDRKPR